MLVFVLVRFSRGLLLPLVIAAPLLVGPTEAWLAGNEVVTP